MEYQGSCLCKSVKYKVIGKFDDFYLCHCKYCRKDTGSAHAANLFSQNAQLIWEKGEDKVKVFHLDETDHMKGFCTICGSALPSLQMNGKLLVVPAGSLDSKLHKKPDGHIFISNKANWDAELEDVVKYDRFPEKNEL